MRILRVLGAVAGGLLLAAAIVWCLDRPVPPYPPIATLPLRPEPAPQPRQMPETMLVYREIGDGAFEIGRLSTRDLAFTPTEGSKPINPSGGIIISGPRIWTLEEQRRGLLPGASGRAVLSLAELEK